MGKWARYSNYSETVDLYVNHPEVSSAAVGGGFRKCTGTSLSAAMVMGRIAERLERG